MTYRPVLVCVAGTYRTASSTQYQITRDIVEESGLGLGIGYHTEGALQKYDNYDATYIVCKVFAPIWLYYYDTHDNLKRKESYGKVYHQQGRLLGVVSIRNPFDILTSMKTRTLSRQGGKRETEPWDGIKVASQDFPKWLGDLEKWCNLWPLTYWSKFETFTQDLATEAMGIAKHLRINLTQEKAQEIAARYTPQKINARKGQEYNRPLESEKRHLSVVPQVVHGTSGHYKDHLTPEEILAVEKYNMDFFLRFDYPLNFRSLG